MIILTQPGITKYNPTRISSSVQPFEGSYFCLAEVPDNFDLSKEDMKKDHIDFWYELTSSLVDADKYKIRKYKGGIVEGIYDQLDLSKELNVAFGIYAIAQNCLWDVWQIWNRSIAK